MKKMKERTKRQYLLSALIIALGAGYMLITGLCIAKPQDNLIPLRILLYTVIWLGILVGIRFFWLWVDRKLQSYAAEKINRYAIVFVSSLFGIVLWCCGWFSGFEPYTDYGNVWDAALALASGTPVANWEYFAVWPNNRFCMLLLAGMLWLGQRIGLSDGHGFVLAVQSVHWCITLACVYRLAARFGKNRIADRWTTVTVFLLMTPLYGYISIFYTDQCSFGFGIMAFTLFEAAVRKQENVKKQLLFAVLAGILWGIGSQIKVTVSISLIALLIVLVTRPDPKYYWKRVGITLIAAMITVGAILGGMKTLPCEKDIYLRSNPALYWVALGLGGNGSHADNEEFAILCSQADNIDVRREIVMEKLKTDWRMFFDADHLVKKVRMNFASGNFGISKYLDYPYKENDLIWQFMSYNGPYFWKYACTSTSYLFAVYILISLGAVRMVCSKESDIIVGVSFVTLFGLVLFLMIWEAQHKQLFNHMGWLVLAAVYGLNWIKMQHKQSDSIGREVHHGRGQENASPGVYQDQGSQGT